LEQQHIVENVTAALVKLDAARPAAIETAEQFETVTAQQVALRAYEDRVKDFFRPMKKAAHDAHKAITTREAEVLSQIKAKLRDRDALAADWLRRERERAEAIQREALAAQTAAVQDAEAILVDAAIADGDVDAVLLAFDASMMDAPPPAISVSVKQVASTALPAREIMRPVVTDKAALLAAIVAGTVPHDVVDINHAALRRYAKEHGGSLPWPGITMDTEISFRRR
jgi:hypothetical protein